MGGYSLTGRGNESCYCSTDNIHESVEPVVVNLDTDDEEEYDLFLESDEKSRIPFDEFYLDGLFTQHVSSSF